MRVLTVRQPWAWAIIQGGKNVENRSRNVAGSYRGPVAIHAGLTPDTTAQIKWPRCELVPQEAWKVRGAVIGVVDLLEVHDARWCCEPWGQWPGEHLVVANPRPLRNPVPAKGRLGLWTPGPELLERINTELEDR